MPPSIRPAMAHDVPAIVALLTQDVRQRGSLDPLLWRIAANAPIGIERALVGALNGSQASAQELWLVAEHAARIVGIAHAMLVPVPPIYDGCAGSPGLLLDDCYVSAEAPSGTPEALVLATEAQLRAAGASRLIASCPAAGPLRPLYERTGYEPVTLFMVKHQHAFPEGRSGSIRVGLGTSKDGHLHLWVEDDGVGFAGRSLRAGGLGQELVRGLCDELKGHLEFKTSESGSSFQLSIPTRSRSGYSDPHAPALVN